MCPCFHSPLGYYCWPTCLSLQDGAASDSLEPAIRLIHLNRVMRQAVRLIRGVQLGIEQDQLRFSVFSAIPWFKVGAGWVDAAMQGIRWFITLYSSARQAQHLITGPDIGESAWQRCNSGLRAPSAVCS